MFIYVFGPLLTERVIDGSPCSFLQELRPMEWQHCEQDDMWIHQGHGFVCLPTLLTSSTYKTREIKQLLQQLYWEREGNSFHYWYKIWMRPLLNIRRNTSKWHHVRQNPYFGSNQMYPDGAFLVFLQHEHARYIASPLAQIPEKMSHINDLKAVDSEVAHLFTSLALMSSNYLETKSEIGLNNIDFLGIDMLLQRSPSKSSMLINGEDIYISKIVSWIDLVRLTISLFWNKEYFLLLIINPGSIFHHPHLSWLRPVILRFTFSASLATNQFWLFVNSFIMVVCEKICLVDLLTKILTKLKNSSYREPL